jgi:hypothetical protein
MLQNNNINLIYNFLSQFVITPSIQNCDEPLLKFENEDIELVTLKKSKLIFLNEYKTLDSIQSVDIINKIGKVVCTIQKGFLDRLSCNKIHKMYFNLKYKILFIHYSINGFEGISFFGVINIKTLISMTFPFVEKNEIQKIGFSLDCSQFGFMNNNGDIFAMLIPQEIINSILTIEQRACMSYICNKLKNVSVLVRLFEMANLSDKITHLHDKQTQNTISQMSKIIKFIQMIYNEKVYISEILYNISYKTIINTITHIINFNSNMQYISNKLNITLDFLSKKIISQEVTVARLNEILIGRNNS